MADRQFLVCYDIENSKIFEVACYTKDKIVILDDVTEKIAIACGQADTRYIDGSNYDFAMECMEGIAEKGIEGFFLMPMTHKYLSNFYIKDMQNSKYYSWFAHSPEEDDKCFQRLIDLWKAGADVVMTAHNLDYEYSYIRYCTNLLGKLIDESCIEPSIIADGTHKIKSITFTRGKVTGVKRGRPIVEEKSEFKIMDTALMTGKPIKKLGKAFGLPKLEYDYEVTRIDKSELTQQDYDYNKRDNEIAMLALEELMGQIPEYKSDILSLPVSATQHNKNICRRNEYVNAEVIGYDGKPIHLYDLHKRRASRYNMPSAETFKYFFNASGGGLIGVNRLETEKWHDGCFSFDIVSAHPSQAFVRRYPVGRTLKEVKPEDYYDILYHLRKCAINMITNPASMYKHYYYDKEWLLLVEFEGLEERELPNGNCINSLGSGTTIDPNRDGFVKDKDGNFVEFNRSARVVGGVSKFGKCIKADRYAKWFYAIDLIYHMTFYKFKKITIHKAYEMELQKCDEYTIRQFEYYGGAKTEYKGFTKMCDDGESYETIYKAVQEGKYAESYTKLALTEDGYKEFLSSELLRVKGIFNGIFGQNYQNPLHYDMNFVCNDNDPYAIKKVGVQDYAECIRKTSVHYCVGAYIAAWSRYELACMMWHCMNNGGVIYYWATDSLKCSGVDEHLFDGWADGVDSAYGERNLWGFGGVDCENKGNPMSIYVFETLKYIGLNYDKKAWKEQGKKVLDTHLTISGFKGEVYMKDYLEWAKDKEYTKDNLRRAKKIIAWKMRHHVIPPKESGKLVREHRFAGARTSLGQVNFGALVGMGYELGSLPDECLGLMEGQV